MNVFEFKGGNVDLAHGANPQDRQKNARRARILSPLAYRSSTRRSP